MTIRTKEIIKKLKELYAWDKYVYNCIRYTPYPMPLTKEKIIKNPPSLRTAFYWADAEEPSFYWAKIFLEMEDYWTPVYPIKLFKI